MLCPSCHRQVARGAGWCGSCGAPQAGADGALELVLADLTRVAVVDGMVIGRAAGSTLRLADPSVSRRHARILAGGDGGAAACLEDAGSSHGTWIDGMRVVGRQPLHDGARIQLGDQVLRVERRRAADEAGRTLVLGPTPSEPPPHPGLRPRLRPGYALKRLDASEGPERWVLADPDGTRFLRLGEEDAALLELVDGRRTVGELVAEAERRFEEAGSGRLARLLAELGERDVLADPAVAGGTGDREGEAGRRSWRGLLTPRVKLLPGLGPSFERLYGGGGWLLFTRPALGALAALAVGGLGAFAYLIARRYGTPFVVADRLGLGALVFLAGRFALVAVHELAHGLALASVGRRVRRAGLKLVVIFPYAFVDTSEAWLEPRRRRMGVSAAGPVADLAVGAVFALGCLCLADVALRDVLFQLAFAAYVGALFNLNPFLDRDGYHLLEDALRLPGLRRRAREHLASRLSDRGDPPPSPALARYAVAGLAWSVAAGALVVVLSLRYRSALAEHVPTAVLWVGLGSLWVAVFVPALVVVGGPLRARLRRPRPVEAA